MGEPKAKGQYVPAIRPIETVDAGVSEILKDQQKHFDELRLSSGERERLLKERQKAEMSKRREKEKMQRRSRVTLDMPPLLQESIAAIANKESVTFSQVVAFLLFEATERYDRQEIIFWGHKYPSDSPRYDWILVHPKDLKRMEKVESRKTKKTGWEV